MLLRRTSAPPAPTYIKYSILLRDKSLRDHAPVQSQRKKTEKEVCSKLTIKTPERRQCLNC